MSVEDLILDEGFLRNVYSIRFTHNEDRMILQVSTRERFMIFEGPFTEMTSMEMLDLEKESTVFEMFFKGFTLTKFGLYSEHERKAIEERLASR